jgi:hypothetical protein
VKANWDQVAQHISDAIRTEQTRRVEAMFTPGTFTTNDIGRTPQACRFTVVDPRTPAKDALIDLDRGEGYFYK